MLNQAREFNDAVRLSGLILTKLDGTARGGAVVSLSSTLLFPGRIFGSNITLSWPSSACGAGPTSSTAMAPQLCGVAFTPLPTLNVINKLLLPPACLALRCQSLSSHLAKQPVG